MKTTTIQKKASKPTRSSASTRSSKSNPSAKCSVLPNAKPNASLAVKLVTLVVILLPLVGLIAAIASVWGWGFTWVELVTLVVMYALTGFGITIGYHRLFTHRSFEAVRPVKFILGALGSMSVEGPLLKWVAVHRQHHHHSDKEHDPHSPHHHGGGVWGVLCGFAHAHLGWMFKADHPGLFNYVRDLQSDRLVRVVSKLFGLWVLLGLLIPAAIGGLITGSWSGALLGFLWGGLARIFLVHHVTWSVNSVCHMWGGQPYDSKDDSRNNAVCGILALGEGWHNNHHAFPTSARHGLAWWQIDFSYMVIYIMKKMHLAWHVRVPSPDAMARKAIA